MGSKKIEIDKSRIAASFSKAAGSYDAAAVLQRQVADELIGYLDHESEPKKILDLGSGTGYCSSVLRVIFPQAQIVNLDLAQAMLLFSRAREQQEQKQEKKHEKNKGGAVNAAYVRADAESLPFLAGTFDLIVSSLTIQWCNNYSALFSELHRVLKEKGCICLSTFGPETLQELKFAWAQVDSYVHVNNFIASSELKKYIDENVFAQVKINEIDIISHYQSLSALARELKAIGAHNMNRGQALGLSSRAKITRLKTVFEAKALIDKGIPVTYALQYLHLVK